MGIIIETFEVCSILHVTDTLQILMSIEFITVSLNHGNCYVGTVSCDTLQVSQQIVECESLLEFTGSILQTTDVAGLQFVAKNTDQLAQRLYP